MNPAPSTTGRRRRKRGPKTGSARHVYGVPVPEGLHEAIEIERGNLSTAESLLGCMAIAMEYDTDADSDSGAGPYYPDVARIARDLVRQSINRLDSLTLQQHLLRNKVKEDTPLLIAGRTYLVRGQVDSHETGVCEYRQSPPRAAPRLADAR
jgi:hypothetical protein